MHRGLQSVIASVLIASGLFFPRLAISSSTGTDGIEFLRIFLYLCSIIGVFWLAAILIRSLDWRMRVLEASEWEHRRLAGRWRYVGKIVLPWLIPIIAFTLFAGISHFSTTEVTFGSITAVAVFFLLLSATVVFAALRFWEKNEREHKDITISDK